jgi:phosphoenolpyruvate carboxykinase (ATP)
MAAKLAQMFHENFAKFVPYVDADVMRASPILEPAVAAE